MNPKFNETQKPDWYVELEGKINAYFKDNKISPDGDWRLYIKTIFWLLTLVSTYIILMLYSPSLSVTQNTILCIIHGISWAGIGFNVVHDAAHGSYSKNKKVNDALSYLFDFMGASSTLWKSKHNRIHHSFANIEGIDDDIDTGNLLRLGVSQKWQWYHLFQGIYATVLYAFIYILWISQKDLQKYLTSKIGNIDIKGFGKIENRLFWVFKIVYVILYWIIPPVLFGWNGVWGYLIAAGICGVSISIVFQLAHIVGKTQFPTINNQEVIESNFQIHQVNTTADFATKDPITSWLLGGLNFQVIHHLFPKISHVHYPEIQKLAKEIFKKYNIRYNEYSTLFGAIWAHYTHIFRMGFNMR
jgi:linoleoyl-CoA desaturase